METVTSRKASLHLCSGNRVNLQFLFYIPVEWLVDCRVRRVKVPTLPVLSSLHVYGEDIQWTSKGKVDKVSLGGGGCNGKLC